MADRVSGPMYCLQVSHNAMLSGTCSAGPGRFLIWWWVYCRDHNTTPDPQLRLAAEDVSVNTSPGMSTSLRVSARPPCLHVRGTVGHVLQQQLVDSDYTNPPRSHPGPGLDSTRVESKSKQSCLVETQREARWIPAPPPPAMFALGNDEETVNNHLRPPQVLKSGPEM